MTPRDNAFLKYDFFAVEYFLSVFYELTHFEETLASFYLKNS